MAAEKQALQSLMGVLPGNATVRLIVLITIPFPPCFATFISYPSPFLIAL